MAYVNTIGKSIYEKDSKKILKEYAMNLEAGISKQKMKIGCLEVDFKQMMEYYIEELQHTKKVEQAITVLKRLINKLIGKKDSGMIS